MIVLDTHAWVWWHDDPDRLSADAAAALAAATTVGVSAISRWELATLERLGRLSFAVPIQAWTTAALGGPLIRSLPVDGEIAMVAGGLPREFPADPADRIIYATARRLGAGLITKDREIRSFDPHLTVW